MEKKELKFYEAPMAEAVELKMVGFLCNSTDGQVEGVENKDDITGGNEGLF